MQLIDMLKKNNFIDKKPYYYGTIQRKRKEAKKTEIVELLNIADNKEDFVEKDIIDRHQCIINWIYRLFRKNNLLK